MLCLKSSEKIAVQRSVTKKICMHPEEIKVKIMKFGTNAINYFTYFYANKHSFSILLKLILDRTKYEFIRF